MTWKQRRMLLAACAAIVFPGPTLAPQAPARPRLVVVVVVDQMRADYLDRYASLFHGGFARLAREGLTFTEARHDHAGTETAPGHATLSTGTYPSHSGIVANNWYDRAEAKVVYAVDDSSVTIGGHPGDAGRSPGRLLTDALGDWVKRASPQSKVYSVAIKDRAAVLMGGHKPDGAYWFNTTDGSYQTSSYYTKQYPAWVDSFNLAKPADRHLDSGWTLLRAPEAYAISGPDNIAAEADGVHITFPHALDTVFTGSRSASYGELIYTPFGDEMTLDFARNLVINENLGADAVPDILWIGCSSGDYVGHRYGPSSWEAEDYYLRLDEYLGSFLDFLDRRVGTGKYVVALSADHGVLPLPELLVRKGETAQRLKQVEAQRAFQRVESQVATELGIAKPLYAGYLEGFLLHNTTAAAKNISPARLQDRLAIRLRDLPFVADVYTATELSSGSAGKRPYFEQFQHSFRTGRSPDLMIRFQPNVLFNNSGADHGTGHGTPYDYDTHVPLVFMGDGIKPGQRAERVKTVDLAPTLSVLIGVPVPGGVDGHALGGLR